MSVFLIGYDLRAPGRNYQGLYDAIQSYPDWAHVLESQWAIVTNKTAAEVRDHLQSYLDANDSLTVITARAPAAWTGLSQQLTEWLKRNLN